MRKKAFKKGINGFTQVPEQELDEVGDHIKFLDTNLNTAPQLITNISKRILVVVGRIKRATSSLHLSMCNSLTG